MQIYSSLHQPNFPGDSVEVRNAAHLFWEQIQLSFEQVASGDINRCCGYPIAVQAEQFVFCARRAKLSKLIPEKQRLQTTERVVLFEILEEC